MTKDNLNHGHRKRLRHRFLIAGAEAVSDYELIEMLLFGANPRQDTKPIAKALLAHFGGLPSIVNASPEELSQVEGVGESTIALIKLMQSIHHRLMKIEIENKNIMGSWQQVLEYCYATMSHLKVEQLRILFLDNKNQILKDEVQQIGTVNHTPVYTREVIKRALEIGASGIVMVHNNLLDHIVIGNGRYVSLRAEGVLV